MNNSVLITGGAGFIGINAAKFFLNKKFKVIIIDNFSRKGTIQNIKDLQSKKYLSKYLKIIKVDLRNLKKINEIIKNIKPKLILHLAGQVAVTTSIINPINDFEINIKGTVNLLEACRNHSKESLIIYSSTNKVYGKIDNYKKTNKLRYYVNKNNITSENSNSLINTTYNINVKGNKISIPKIKFHENSNLDFYSPYGCSKGAADQYVRDYSRIYGLKTVVLRQSCIYGRNQFGIEDQGWVAWFIIAFMLKKKITIYGNGKQVRDLLFVDDLCNLFLRIYKKRKKCSGEIFNIGGGLRNTLSLLELVKLLKTKFKLDTKINFGKERDGDQKIFVSDNSKIKKFVNWEPTTSFNNGIKEIIYWTEENLDKIKKL